MRTAAAARRRYSRLASVNEREALAEASLLKVELAPPES